MAGTAARRAPRFDRTLRAVMWTDALLSAALAIVCLVASPVVAVLGVPQRVLATLAVTAVGLAALLAGCGAITALLIVLRMRRGHYLLPERLRLPFPAVMRPE
jgi:hypothetical protein